MPLARIKTWNAGDTLTAADLNAEFNNPLNNPISLVSPTTGAINFQTSILHTNLVVSALTASSGLMGQALIISSSAGPAWSNLGVSAVISSSGNQTFTSTAFTNSNVTATLTGRSTAPRFQLLSAGSMILSSGNIGLTFRVDSTYIGVSGGSFGIQLFSVPVALSGQNWPFSLSYVTSALSTASHTFGLAINVSTGTLTLYQSDPTLTFSAVELLGS